MTDLTDNVNKNASKAELDALERLIALGFTKHAALNKTSDKKKKK